MKDKRGKRSDHKSPVRQPAADAAEYVAEPPKRRPLLLIVSSALIVAWIVFLAVMAFRH